MSETYYHLMCLKPAPLFSEGPKIESLAMLKNVSGPKIESLAMLKNVSGPKIESESKKRNPVF